MKKTSSIKILIPLIIILGSIYALRSGVVVRKMPELNNEPISITLFHIISLFTFGAKDFGVPIAGPLSLRILLYCFYFIAPLVTLVAMADLMSLIRPAFIKWIMNRRSYYVIIGYGKMGKAVMDAIKIKKGKKTYVLILDKNIDESEKGLSVIFEHTFYFRKEVEHINKWSTYISKNCAGIFIVTDDELLNLRIYDAVKVLCNIDTLIYNRIHSMEISLKWDNSSTKQNLNFVNTHIAAPDLLFQPKLALNNICKENQIGKHFFNQYEIFSPWIEKKYEILLFVGFGTFSQYLLRALAQRNAITASTEIYIVDPNGRKNWNEIIVELPQLSFQSVSYIENDFSYFIDKLPNEFDTTNNINLLGIYATNNDFENLQAASFINRKYKQTQHIHNIVRTHFYNLLPEEMLKDFFYTNKFVVVPTFSWTQLDVELLLD